KMIKFAFAVFYRLVCTILYQENPSDDVFLDCASRELVAVPNDIPKDSAVVKLNSNQLKRINTDDFCDLSKLRILDLGDNQISVTLKTLKLTWNTLSTLTNNIFQALSITDIQIFQLPQIQTVNLTHNLFSSFETKHLLHNFTLNLKELIISSPNMRTFSISTPIFPNIMKLDLAVCRNCTFLNWDIPDKTFLKNITPLYTSQPCFSFKSFQKVLQSLDSLNHLRLNNMDRFIKELLSAVCKIPTLRKLDNHLNNLRLKLALCSQLTELDLGETHINELSKGSIKSMTNLQTFSLRINQLSEVPYGIRNLSTLKILNIEFNQISKLSCDDFVNTTHLTELYLHGNYITKLKSCVYRLRKLEDVFKLTLHRLEVLDISDNKVTDLEMDAFQSNLQLKSVTFVETDMSNLDPNLLQPIPNLQTLDLSNCKIKALDFMVQNEISFILWAKNQKQTQVANTHQYICSFPTDKRGSLLFDYDILSCWDDSSFFCFVSSSCLVVLTLVTSFVYNFLRWELGYTFHFFRAFLYDSRKRKDGDDPQFDTFVSYHINDEDWVYREMLPMLEEEQGWRLCLHHRDFQPGKPIIGNISDAIYGSRKTICVISRSYLESKWCSREIQMARWGSTLLLCGFFLNKHWENPFIDPSSMILKLKLLKKRTYLSWSVQHPGVFWQNVQRALQAGDAPENPDMLI
uniref:TIR domain-containing protein n=1 Tax=Poecilia reticulata TaxID=8081 RepID=A0A3P9PVX7_POERE